MRRGDNEYAAAVLRGLRRCCWSAAGAPNGNSLHAASRERARQLNLHQHAALSARTRQPEFHDDTRRQRSRREREDQRRSTQASGRDDRKRSRVGEMSRAREVACVSRRSKPPRADPRQGGSGHRARRTTAASACLRDRSRFRRAQGASENRRTPQSWHRSRACGRG